MAKIIGTQSIKSKNGKEYFTYYFVAQDDNVNGYFCGEFTADHELLHPETQKPIKIDDLVSLNYSMSALTGVSRTGSTFTRYIRNYYLSTNNSI